MPRRSVEKNGVGIGRRSVVIVVGLLVLASACSSSADPGPSASPPKTGSGAQEEDLPALADITLAKTGAFLLENLAMGVVQGAGTLAFNWVVGLISPDKTPQQLEDIQKGVDEIEKNVEKLDTEVTAMRSTMDQDFKNEQGAILDQGLAPDRKTIDDATLKLKKFTADTQEALAAGTELPRVNDYLRDYGDPLDLSDLYNLLDHDLHTALTVGGSDTGGGSLIASADAMFAGQQAEAEAAKTAAPFDDRPLRARLGLAPAATQAEITTACDELRARQPASSVCATPGAGGTPNVNYYDRMQTFTDYYVNYQVNGLLVLLTALMAWDDDGRCPVPAEGECAKAKERAQQITVQVIDNVRTQMAMAGAPVSTDERVLEIVGGDTASLWSTSTTPATYTQTPPSTPPNGWPDWRVPIDCTRTGEVVETNRPDEGIPCSVRNNPYVVTVPSEAPEDQICVGAPAIGTDVAAKQGGTNGQFDALPSEWADCAGSAGTAGRRVPTHQEMQSALAKNPDTWIESLGDPSAATAFGSATLLSSTPSQVVCGYPVGDDETNIWLIGDYSLTAINVNRDKWVGGRAETWTRSSAWQASAQYSWAEPLVLSFDSSGNQITTGYDPGGPCERVEGNLTNDGHADVLLPHGFVQCVANPATVHDWCWGHRNYKGADLPAAGKQMHVWAAHSLVACPSQQPDSGTGVRPAAWQATGCEPDLRPNGRNWEIPACRTAAGRWSRCGTTWVDELLAPPPPLPTPAPTTSTTSSSTTTAPPVATTEADPAPTTGPTSSVPAVPTTVVTTAVTTAPTSSTTTTRTP